MVRHVLHDGRQVERNKFEDEVDATAKPVPVFGLRQVAGEGWHHLFLIWGIISDLVDDDIMELNNIFVAQLVDAV